MISLSETRQHLHTLRADWPDTLGCGCAVVAFVAAVLATAWVLT